MCERKDVFYVSCMSYDVVMTFVNRLLSLLLFTACGNDFCKSFIESAFVYSLW